MVSETELVERLREFLSSSDLNQTTSATVRRKLEEDFGIDLSDKKAFIREQIDIYLQESQENEENNAGEEGEGDENGATGEEGEVEENGAAEEEEEEDEDDELREPNNNGKRPAKKGSKKKNREVKRRGGGFSKLCSLSPQLQKFIGVPELARTEVVKKLWIYIRENNLQDPANRRNILCDDTLRELFGVDTINMFQMNKALAKHIWPLETNGASVSSPTKEKPRKQDREEELPDEPKRKEKRQKGGNSAFLASLPLSDALVKFLDTGENALPRSDVVKRIWDYIKQNNLQDPSDRRMIICDKKLKELFDVDTFQGFTVPKLLKNHFIKPEQ